MAAERIMQPYWVIVSSRDVERKVWEKDVLHAGNGEGWRVWYLVGGGGGGGGGGGEGPDSLDMVPLQWHPVPL